MSAKGRPVAILGGGRMGQAVARILAAGGARVFVWERNEQARAALQAGQRDGELAGVEITDELETPVSEAQVLFFAVPAPAFLDVADQVGPWARGDHIVIHGARGVGEGFLLPHQAIRRKTCLKKIGALGGPLYFDDLAARRPLFVALGSRYPEVVGALRFMTEKSSVRLHPCSDLIGVEVAGAISNVAHLAAGMVDGLELGETAKGVLLTRGISEASILGCALGAEPSTFTGLAGVGDLIPRKVSSTQRHDDVGRSLGLGATIAEAMAEVEGHVEGVLTAREGRQRGEALGLKLPLIEAVADVIDGRGDPGLRLEEVLDMDLFVGAEAVR